MTPLRSLRSRLILGSILWASGLLAIAAVIAITVVHLRPDWAAMLHNVMFTLFAVVCLVAGLAQIRRGLSPFNQLRVRLSAVRDGRERRVEGDYPSEVQPLVDDLNALLEDRERRVGRALAKAGDLAHGLKTPLAVLAQEAERARAAGHHDLAEVIGQQVDRMRRQIDSHLAQSRAAASVGASPDLRCAVADSAEALARTLRRLHDGRGIAIQVNAAADHVVRARREDLDEMLGNLLDNACKWAASTVILGSSRRGDRVVVTVDDDGPGLDASLREAVLQRGIRADEAAPGSGVGLAIVRDLVELHGGSISLDTSPTGGLRAQLELPASDH